jgi:hypothetical protein
MSSSDLTEIRRCRALLGGCPGPAGTTGATGATGIGATGATGATGFGFTGATGATGQGFTPQIGSFISIVDQGPPISNPETTPVAITFSSRTEGNINVVGAYPTGQILIPVTGTYRFLFSAQCISTGSHYIEIWPTVNGTSIPDSNTRLRVPSNTETCLTVEYIVSFNANDTLQLYLRGDSDNGHLVYIPGNPATTPVVPNIPSIILTIHRIG